MADYTDFVGTWTLRLREVAGDCLDEEEARALVAEMYEAATRTDREDMARLEAEREE